MKILIVMNDYFNQSNGISISAQRFAEEASQAGSGSPAAAETVSFSSCFACDFQWNTGCMDTYKMNHGCSNSFQGSRTKRNRRCQAPAVF